MEITNFEIFASQENNYVMGTIEWTFNNTKKELNISAHIEYIKEWDAYDPLHNFVSFSDDLNGDFDECNEYDDSLDDYIRKCKFDEKEFTITGIELKQLEILVETKLLEMKENGEITDIEDNNISED